MVYQRPSPARIAPAGTTKHRQTSWDTVRRPRVPSRTTASWSSLAATRDPTWKTPTARRHRRTPLPAGTAALLEYTGRLVPSSPTALPLRYPTTVGYPLSAATTRSFEQRRPWRWPASPGREKATPDVSVGPHEPSVSSSADSSSVGCRSFSSLRSHLSALQTKYPALCRV